ncbi:tubulin-binding protein [Pasteurellaceae bacterium LFhippo2]|nr:tubulin-binding protein [Pasteurellaceae bacterium LFhippo2]
MSNGQLQETTELQQDSVVEQSVLDEKQAKQVESPKKRSKLRWFWCALLLLLLIIIAPILFLSTGYGQRTALSLADKFVDQLSVGKVEGSLQDGLTLADTRFQMDGLDINVGQADLHIGFQCIMDREACVENLALKDTSIIVDTKKLPKSKKDEQATSGDIRLPISVSAKNLSIDNLNVTVDGMDIALKHFHSGVSGKDKDINLSPTLIDGLTLSLEPEEVKDKLQEKKENIKEAKRGADWKAIKEQLAKPLLTKLDPIKLPLNFDIPEFKATNIAVLQKVKNKDGSDAKPTSILKAPLIALQAKSNEESVTLSKLDIQTDKGNVVGNGSLKLSGNYPLNWKLKANSSELKEFKIPASNVELTVSGELFGSTNLAIQTAGAVKATVKGSVKLAEPKTPLNLTIASDQVTYPFIAEKGVDPLKLQKVNIALKGDLLNYQLDTSLNASGMNLPESSAQLKGKGELTHFVVDDLTLNALQGTTNLNGKVDWSDGVEWKSALKLNGVNTKSLTPEWAALLSGSLETAGYAARGKDHQDWSVNLSNMDLHGNLQQKNLQLKGELTADSKTLLNVPNASLIYGPNTINLKGVLGDNSDFNADIKAPNLQGLVPNLKASINGNVKMKGKLTEPMLDLDLTADNVAYDELKLQHLTAKGKVAAANQIQGDVIIGLRQFSYGDIKVENANLEAKGSETNHTLKLTSKGDPVGANLQLAGKFDRNSEIWSGQLSNIAVQSPVGEWENDKAIQVSYNNKQINANVSAHCWRNPKLNVCFPQSFNAGKEGKVPFEIKQFDLAMVQEYLDKNSQISGVVSAKGDAAWFTNKQPQVNVELNSNAIKFVQKVDYSQFPITLSPVKINANIADNNLKLKTDIKIENNGRLTSDLVMNDLANKRALSGNINLDKINLKLVSPLLSNGEKVDGDINARLTVGGTALSPLLYGNLNLTGLMAKSNAMPFDITGGNLALNFNGATSTLKGNIKTTESDLILEGDANWKKLDAWYTRVSAKANRFRVNIPNMAKVDVSPDIEVKATPREIILGGRVDIPWARIEVEELPESAVNVSSDEVIMDSSAKNKRSVQLPIANSNKNAPITNTGMAVKADIAINIGNDVKVDAYGLKTDLNGTIKVRQGNKGLGLYGQVNMKNGTFASFGQDLVIRKGLITFSGLPSQPSLDIEAIRNPEAIEDSKVTAGVKVTGIADALDVKLFSTPSMSQDQILSYILTGRGLDNNGDAGSSNSVAAALIGMSLSKSGKSVGKVGSAFGISDLNVTTAGIGDNTKVVVSGSLTPKFKVKYGVGLFAPLTELTLRYRLAPSLFLQSVSSVNQAVDLLYSFEFD